MEILQYLEFSTIFWGLQESRLQLHCARRLSSWCSPLWEHFNFSYML